MMKIGQGKMGISGQGKTILILDVGNYNRYIFIG